MKLFRVTLILTFMLCVNKQSSAQDQKNVSNPYKSDILLNSPNNKYKSMAKKVRFLEYLNETKSYIEQILKNQRYQREQQEKSNLAFRPKDCPLKSNKYNTLSAKIHLVVQELKNNPKCTNALEGTFKNINSSLDKLKGLEDEYKKNYDLFSESSLTKTADEIENEQNELLKRQVVIGGVQSMLNSFTTVAANSECQDTMTKTQITSNLADAIFGISGLGLLAPGPAGYGTAVGGMAVGSLLKIISLLLKPSWDFDKEKDRNNFVKISCSLFDIKTDIEEVGLLSTRTVETSSELKIVKVRIKDLEERIGILNASMQNYSKAKYFFEKGIIIAALKKTDLKEMDPNIQLYQHFREARSILRSAISARTSAERADILIALYKVHQDISNIIKGNSNNLLMDKVARHRDFKETRVTWPQLIKGVISADQLWQKVLKNRKTEEKDFNTFITNFMKPIEWLEKYQIKIVNQKKGGLSTVVNDPRFKAKRLIQRLVAIKGAFEIRAKYLEGLEVGRVFSDSDNGAITKTNILENLSQIQEKIYGKVGKKFMGFVTDKGMRSMKEFKKGYDRIQTKLQTNNKDLCREVINLRLRFHVAQSYSGLGYDFLQANKDSFYNPKRSWLIFSKGWQQSRLMEHFKTSNEVAKLINDNNGNIPQVSVNKFKKLAFNTLGAIMYEVSSQYQKQLQLQQYIARNNCTRKKQTITTPNWHKDAEL